MKMIRSLWDLKLEELIQSPSGQSIKNLCVSSFSALFCGDTITSLIKIRASVKNRCMKITAMITFHSSMHFHPSPSPHSNCHRTPHPLSLLAVGENTELFSLRWNSEGNGVGRRRTLPELRPLPCTTLCILHGEQCESGTVIIRNSA